jgi:hypothetical protein
MRDGGDGIGIQFKVADSTMLCSLARQAVLYGLEK